MDESSRSDSSSDSIDATSIEDSPPDRSEPPFNTTRPQTLLKGPSILPFSSEADDPPSKRPSSFNDPDTTIDGLNSENEQSHINLNEAPRSNPVIRETARTKELQLKYFDLQMELKKIRDELNSSGQSTNSQLVEEQTAEEDEILPENIKLKEAQNSAESFRESNKALTQRIEQLIKSESTLRQRNNSLNSELLKAKAEVAKLQNESSSPKPAKTSIDMEQLRSELDIARGELHSIRVRESTLKSENTRLTNELKHLHYRYPSKRNFSETSVPSEELEDVRKKLHNALVSKATLSKMLEEQLSANNNSSSLLDQAGELIASLRTDITKLNQHIQDKTADTDRLKTSLEEAQKKIGSLENSVKTHTDKLKALQNDAVISQQKLDDKDNALKDAKNHKEALEKRISEQQHEINELTNVKKSHTDNMKILSRDLTKLKSELTEAHNKIETLIANNQNLSSLNDESMRDNRKLQTEIDKLQHVISDLEHDNGSQSIKMSELDREISTMRSNLAELKAKSVNKENELREEITDLNTQISTLTSELASQEKRHHSLEVELNKKMAEQIAAVKSKCKNEIRDIKQERMRAEHDLNSQLAKALSELELIKNEKDSIESSRNTLAIRTRQDQSEVKNLTESIAEKSKQLISADERYRIAKSKADEYLSQLETKRISEKSLLDEINALKDTIASQAVALKDNKVEDIAYLRSQAQEGIAAVNELAKIREEFSTRNSQWLVIYNDLNSNLESYKEVNSKLQEELMLIKNNESQREAQLRSNVYAAHQRELESLKADYESSKRILDESYKAAEQERNDLRSRLFDAETKLRQYEFISSTSEEKIGQIQNMSDHWKEELTSLREEHNKLLIQSSQSRDQLHELRIRLREIESSYQSKEALVNDLSTQLSESQKALKINEIQKLEIQDQIRGKTKLFNEYLNRLHNILYAYSFQMDNLVFIKFIYSKRFPRLDIRSPDELTLRKPKRRTFRGLAMFVLAAVKFSSAAKVGIKRHSEIDGQYIVHHLNDLNK